MYHTTACLFRLLTITPVFCFVCVFKIPIATVPFLLNFFLRPRWPVAEDKERIYLF